MPVVYLDVVWLINFVMDGVLLVVTAWLSRRPLRPKRIAAGALLGAMYSVLLFFPRLALLTSWPGKAVVSLLMVVAAVPCRRWLECLRVGVMFYFVSFVFAGAALALHYAIPGTTLAGAEVTGSRVVFAASLRSLALLVAIPLAGFVVRYGVYRIQMARHQGQLFVPVRLGVGGRSVTLVGLVDTGNRLRDPVSRKPVCLVEGKACVDLLPSELRCAVHEGRDLIYALEAVTDGDWRGRFTLVPFRGAGGSAELAVAFRPDAIELQMRGEWHAGRDCLVALHPGELSSDREFQVILHTAVITEADGFDVFPTTRKDSNRMANADAPVVDSHPGSVGRRL
ncbi:MAG: sigma-E processing peptidase SpoIIGA [Alicyclobacillus herbarius]|uniref:sigma-E processing peptidase SpoIIGA n=1 Tax=Alicyclobacillus herbarius TaxID=122960 RepID=UPI000400E160|nr:sigma-E processing peptidase SpoIIGA [Alicyclobacillus herbarius]MCL6631681.1 sigma-E processing peptidase SpoIIGA [Alicyclobacillus herbarius]